MQTVCTSVACLIPHERETTSSACTEASTPDPRRPRQSRSRHVRIGITDRRGRLPFAKIDHSHCVSAIKSEGTACTPANPWKNRLESSQQIPSCGQVCLVVRHDTDLSVYVADSTSSRCRSLYGDRIGTIWSRHRQRRRGATSVLGLSVALGSFESGLRSRDSPTALGNTLGASTEGTLTSIGGGCNSFCQHGPFAAAGAAHATVAKMGGWACGACGRTGRHRRRKAECSLTRNSWRRTRRRRTIDAFLAAGYTPQVLEVWSASDSRRSVIASTTSVRGSMPRSLSGSQPPEP